MSFFRGFDLDKLGLDEAYLNVTTGYLRDPVYIYRRNGNCDGCPFQKVGEVGDSGKNFTLSTHYPWFYRFRRSDSDELITQTQEDSDALCTKEFSVGEFGVYNLRLSDDGTECKFETALESGGSGWALLWCTLIMIALGLLYRLVMYLNDQGKLDSIKEAWYNFKESLGFKVKRGEEEPEPTKARLKSLDTFRGITIALMIFVNDGAGGFYFFEHATWNGLYLADLAFPWFMWIMGFCIPMSVRSQQRKQTPLPVVMWAITKRSVKLFLLGFFWGNANWINFARVRIPGVLQRFAVVYFVVATTGAILARYMPNNEVKPKKKDDDDNSDNNNKEQEDKQSKFTDLLIHWPRWLVALFTIILHTCIVYFMPVPGCPTGYVGPGGLHDDAQYPKTCIGGATGYVDVLVFGKNHIYSNPTPKHVYQTTAFDPEGLLGCLSSIFQVFLGYQGGQIILSFTSHKDRMARFTIWGVLLTFLGLCLCGFSVNSGPIPMNKNIWSLSYVLVTSGLAFALMVFVYALVDVKNWWGGEPFFYAGMNSILLYLGHGTAWQMFPFNYYYDGMNTHWDRLPESLLGVSLWMLVAYILYRKRIFIVV